VPHLKEKDILMQTNAVMRQIATWPPLVYFILGVVILGFWAAGTAVQVLTSESWIMHAPLSTFPTLSVFGQCWDFIWGKLPASEVVPFTFGWGVQIALLLASVGVELPKYPAWRYYSCWCIIILLIGVNSCGDYVYSQDYGAWGAIGFTIVILFVTFCAGLLAVMCFMHGYSKMHGGRR
jgi:hypothetical protein